MKQLFITSLLFVSFFHISYAQEHQTTEVIRYYDGSVFYGFTIEDDGRDVLFELASTRDTIHLVKNLIKGVVNSDSNIITGGGRYHRKVGYLTGIRANFGGNGSGSTYQFDAYLSKLLKPNLVIGMGLGFSESYVSGPTWEYLPFAEVFLFGRRYLNDKPARAFAEMKLGASIPTYSAPWLSYSAGPLLQGGFGWQFATKRKVKWELRFSQMVQRTVIDPQFNDFVIGGGFPGNFERAFVSTKILLARTFLGIGLVF